VDVCWL